MQKLLLVAFVICSVTAADLSYMLSCSSFECPLQFDSCLDDQGCSETFYKCAERCEKSTNPTDCQQSCLYSSNSLAAQKFTACASTNNCFANNLCASENDDCPSTCLSPVKKALDSCSNEAGYPDLACAQTSLAKSHPECQAKQCVCSLTLTLGLYIAGCQC